ncbi:MAG: FMN-binding protein [Clostridiales bacterium]|nr:FMN-binding protein [Clostridiales bacterium]
MKKRKSLIILAIVVVVIISFFLLGSIGKKEMMELEIDSVDMTQVEDGIYAGSFSGFRWNDTVEVTVLDHKIVDIVSVEPISGGKETTVGILVERIMENQSLQVDTVSKATATSNGFLKAVENALMEE